MTQANLNQDNTANTVSDTTVSVDTIDPLKKEPRSEQSSSCAGTSFQFLKNYYQALENDIMTFDRDNMKLKIFTINFTQNSSTETVKLHYTPTSKNLAYKLFGKYFICDTNTEIIDLINMNSYNDFYELLSANTGMFIEHFLMPMIEWSNKVCVNSPENFLKMKVTFFPDIPAEYNHMERLLCLWYNYVGDCLKNVILNQYIKSLEFFKVLCNFGLILNINNVCSSLFIKYETNIKCDLAMYVKISKLSHYAKYLFNDNMLKLNIAERETKIKAIQILWRELKL